MMDARKSGVAVGIVKMKLKSLEDIFVFKAFYNCIFGFDNH
jgi:hypothetical protein